MKNIIQLALQLSIEEMKMLRLTNHALKISKGKKS